MSVVTLQVWASFECRGPPLPTDLNPPTFNSTATSPGKVGNTDGNVTHLPPYRRHHSLDTECPDAGTLSGPEYDLADAIDQLGLSSDDDDDVKELGTYGRGGTKRSNAKSSDAHEDSGTTAPKKRHQSSQREPCSPPVHLPRRYDTPQNNDGNVNIVNQLSNMTGAGFHVSEISQITPSGTASVCGEHLPRSSTVPSQSSSLKETPQTPWNVPGSETDPNTTVQNAECSSRSSDSILSHQHLSAQGLECSTHRSESKQVIPATNPAGARQLPSQFPSVGRSPSKNEELPSDVDPDGAAECFSEQEVQRITEYLEASHSEDWMSLEVEVTSSEAHLLQQMEDFLMSSEAAVAVDQLRMPAGPLLPGSEPVPVLGPPVCPAEPAVSVVSRRPVVTAPPVTEPCIGPPPATSGPSGPGPGVRTTTGLFRTVPENGPQRMTCVADSSCTKMGVVMAGPLDVNRICLSGLSRPGEGCSETSPASVSLAASRQSGGNSSNINGYNASRIDSHNASRIDSHNASHIDDHNTSRVNNHNASGVDSHNASHIDSHNASHIDSHVSSSAITCPSYHPRLVHSQQTRMSSGKSAPSVEKVSGVMHESQGNSSSFSFSSPSLHSSTSFVRPESHSFSGHSDSSKSIKKVLRGDSTDCRLSCPGHPSAQEHLHGSSPSLPAFLVPSNSNCRNLSRNRRQRVQGCSHTDVQMSDEAMNPQTVMSHIRPQSLNFSSTLISSLSDCTPMPTSSTYPDQTSSTAGCSAPEMTMPSRCYSFSEQPLSGKCHTVLNHFQPSCPSSTNSLNPTSLPTSVAVVTRDQNSSFQQPSWPRTATELSDQHGSSTPRTVSPQLVPSNCLADHRGIPCPSYPVPLFGGEIPGMGNDSGERKEGRSLTVWFENGTVSEEVVNAVCDVNGVWLTESEGDTFLHSLSGWEDEEAAVDALHRVREKPSFDHALNQYNRNTETPLYSAVCFGKRSLVEAMLDSGADVNRLCCFDTLGQTALHKAVENRDTAMVSTLLRSPFINVNAKRFSDRCTPLMVSLMKHVPAHPTKDHFDIIHLMLEEEEKPDFFAVDQRSGKTIFMMTVETKDARLVELILQEVGADDARRLANMQNRAGNSAVHLAAGLRGVEDSVKKQILKILIQSGGDTALMNKEKESPNDWAGKLIKEIQAELT